MRELVVTAALAFVLGVPRADAEAPPTVSYEKYRLPNGLEVIVSPDHSLPIVSVDIWYHVGAGNETRGRTGFAHLFEHMMFTGTKHIPRGMAEKLLEAAGGTDSNATTSFDRTNYFDTVPSNQLELALWTHADRMGYLLDSLDQKALANQQDVVRNERRQSIENRPYGIVDEAVFHALFPADHPYRPYIMGSHADIQAARLADVRDFFKRYYRPNNATLAIVGDFDSANAKRLVTKYFASFKRGPDIVRPSMPIPKITEEHRETVTDQIELERVDLAWLTPPRFQPGDAELEIAAHIIAGGKSSRLYKKLVYDLQLAQEVSADQDSYALASVFNVEALARPGHAAAELQAAVDAELERFIAEGPTEAEVERARNQIERQLYQSLQKAGGRADLLNLYNHYLGDPGYLPKDIERYARATAADVKRAMQTYLSKNARVVVLAVRGEKKLDPDPPASAAIPVRGTDSINADEPWRNKAPKAAHAIVPHLPAPASFKLSNGLTVLHAERPNLPIVSMQLVVKAGLAASDPALPGVGDFATALLEEGTQSHDALELADAVEQLGASYATQTRRDTTTLRMDALARNAPNALGLLAEIAQHPTFPDQEVERQRKMRLSSIAEVREDASALADAAMVRALYGAGHPYGRTALGTEDATKRITATDLRKFWQRNFRPDNAALVVVGAIDADRLRRLAEREFGAWSAPGTDPAASVVSDPAAKPVRVVVVDKPGAPQTELRVGRVGTIRTNPEFPALQVLNEAIGGAFSSRLNLNLREQKGYTYDASSRFDAGRMPAPFVIRTAVRADAAGPAVKEIFSELKRAESAPLAPDELERARGSLRQSLSGLFETNGVTASSFGELFAYGLVLDYYKRLPAEFGAVNAPVLERLARRYLDPSSMTLIAIGDRQRLQTALATLDLGPIEVWTITGTLF